MHRDRTDDWDRLVRVAQDDLGVLGLVLTGGRGKGLQGPASDWDAIVVVDAGSASRWRALQAPWLDLSVLSLQEFAVHAEPGSSTA